MSKETQEFIGLINKAEAGEGIREKFLERFQQGRLTKEENLEDHIGVFFCVYDPKLKKILIGKHKKSGLWLAYGGHIKQGESFKQAFVREAEEELGLKVDTRKTSDLHLLTISQIVNLDPTRKCKVHYDYWYFLPIDSINNDLDWDRLSVELDGTFWASIEEARGVATDPTTLSGIDFVEKNLFNK